MNGFGSSSNSGTYGSHISGSTSTPQNHSHNPATTTGVNTQVPYLSPQQPEYPDPPPFYSLPQQPVPFYPSSFGYGFAGNMGSFQSSRSNSQQSHSNGSQYASKTFQGSNGGFKGKNFRQNGNSSWSGNIDIRTNVVIKCQICNKRGYTAANCYHRNNNNVSGNGFWVECQICGKRSYSTLECFHRGNYVFQGHPPPPFFNAMSAQQTSSYGPADSWIVDFGASHHMTADMNGLSQVMPFEGSEKITIRNGIDLSIQSVGPANKRDIVSRKEYAKRIVPDSSFPKEQGFTICSFIFSSFGRASSEVTHLALEVGSSCQ
ncbi:unnamed protein product [Malus baccata var. baccata]